MRGCVELRPVKDARRKLTVLIVEDDAFARSFASEALKSIGGLAVDRHFAGTCAEAYLKIKTTKPEIVFLDIGLPDGTGFDLIPAVREQSPACYIVMLTARKNKEDVVKAKDSGADAYVAKPFNIKRLQAVIDAFLKR